MNRLLFDTIKNRCGTSGFRQSLKTDVGRLSKYSLIHAALERAPDTDSRSFHEPEFRKIASFKNIYLNNLYFNKFTKHSLIYYMLSSRNNYTVSLTYWRDEAIYGHIDQYSVAFYFQIHVAKLCMSIKTSSYSVVNFLVHCKISPTYCIIFEYFKFIMISAKSTVKRCFFMCC